jgi:hypothetical protein
MSWFTENHAVVLCPTKNLRVFLLRDSGVASPGPVKGKAVVLVFGEKILLFSHSAFGFVGKRNLGSIVIPTNIHAASLRVGPMAQFARIMGKRGLPAGGH